MTARWNIGLARNPEPPDAVDQPDELLAWLAECPAWAALSCADLDAIEAIVKNATEGK
jgi:hypothetical protein